MHVRVERWSDCRPELSLLWLEMRRDNPALASPYFHPKFTGIIDAAWPQPVEIACVHEGGGIKAMLPFHRLGKGLGVPVGHFLSDYHGLICRPHYQCDLRELIRGCGLSIFDYDHALAYQSFSGTAEPSPQIDLSGGADSYLASEKAVKSEQIKIRRIERDLGPLRFVAHSTDELAWMRFASWKSEQYERTGARNIFLLQHVQKVLKDIRDSQDKHFSGMFSLLYAGPRLVAAHFGMRSGPLLHSWFPVYDHTLSTYSPGLLLLIKLIEASSDLKVTKIDLGKGMYQWKQRFANSHSPVLSGSVEIPSLPSLYRVARRRAGTFARETRARVLGR